MTEERQEVYERIPWETLEKQSGDRQWLLIAVAAAVALGALAYSFMQNQPAPTPDAAATVDAAVTDDAAADQVATTAPVSAAPPDAAAESSIGPPPTVASPMVAAEADLYAVDPERLIDQVVAHAEWFAVEYFSFDGSNDGLSTLMPSGLPLPRASEGTQVFVDWAGGRTVTEVGPLAYEVEVVVRSLVSDADGAFTRQPTRIATVPIVMGSDGQPSVGGAPSVAVPSTTPTALTLGVVPETVAAAIDGEVVGGQQLADGRWKVVAMITGADGVIRPTTLVSP